MGDVAFVRPATQFIGRVLELGRLRELTGAARAGRSAAVLISGDAGVGKTSLVAEAARRAGAEGALVMLGRCVDLGTGALPYLPFADALTQLLRDDEQAPAAAIVRQAAADQPALARIAGAPGGVPSERASDDSGLDRLALFESFAGLLGRLGDELGPVLLVLEDLHWADPSSRDLVRFLLTRLGGDRLLVIATYRADDLHRTHPLRPLMAQVQRLPQVERMALAPFGADELAAFLQSVAGPSGDPVPAELLARITDRSAGNAYYAEELLAAGGADGLPTALADILLDRLERLSPPAQQVVRAASVFGNARIEDARLRAVVASATTEGAGVVEAALREAIAHQLLVPEGVDRYAFRHALLQEAVYADLLPGERVRLHSAAAAQLAGSQNPGAAAELARHSLAAHDLPSALSASLLAAREATRRSGPAQALDDYEQALQLWDAVAEEARPAGRDVVEIGVAAAMAAGDAGWHQRALALARAALARAEAGDEFSVEQAARARASVALHLYPLDRAAEAQGEARRVIADLADQKAPSPARARARSMVIRVDLAFNEGEAALAQVPAALAEARELGLLKLIAELLTWQATAEGMVGRPEVQQRWEQARAAAEEAGDTTALMRVVYASGIDRIDAGDLTSGAQALEESLALAEAAGLAGSLLGGQARWQLIIARWQLGDAEAALAISRAGRLPPELVRQLRVFVLAIRAAREPQRVADVGASLAGAGDWEDQLLQTALAEAYPWLGRFEEAVEAGRSALAHLDAVNEPFQLAGIAIDTAAVSAVADLATKARLAGDFEARRRLSMLALPFLADARDRARLGRPRRFTMGPEGLAWLARLEAEAARLYGADVAQRWAGVAEAFEGVSVYEQARARWRQAERLLVEGGPGPQVREVVALARAAAERLGAEPLAQALDELVRRARLEVTRAPAGALLTPREHQVMTLVAEGKSNRVIGEELFISEKTASVHVSNVLAKLGASGRTEAVAIMSRTGLLGRIESDRR